MRLTTVILIASLMQVSASTFGQRITINESNVSLKTVLKEIRKQSGYDILYDGKAISNSQQVSVKVTNATIDETLSSVFKGLPFTYEVSEKNVTIKKKEESFLDNIIARFQDIDVRGRVVNERGEPLIGASVAVKGGRGTTTDKDGNFYLEKLEENALLVIFYIGYQKREFRANEDLSRIVLELSNSKLDEVQVIAYGTTSRRLSTGNVTTVKAKDIENQPVNNPLLALQGRVPGLLITQATGYSGTGVTVRIQGQNSMLNGNDPLYVVDGLPYFTQNFPGLNYVTGDSDAGKGSVLGRKTTGNPLNYINPSDIESIDILKDADATAIYGSRAANGAILITTKKGKVGKNDVNFNFQTGFGQVATKLAVLNTEQYLEMRREGIRNNGSVPDPDKDYDLFENYGWSSKRNNDWQEELIGHTAKYNDLQSSISGGTNNLQYILGGNYHRETTVLPVEFSDQKISGHFNLNTNSNDKKFTMSFSSTYLLDDNRLPTADLTEFAVSIAPNAPALYNGDGSINYALTADGRSTLGGSNPASLLLNKSRAKTTNLISNIILGYKILDGLTVKSSFNLNRLQFAHFTKSDPTISVQSGRQLDCRVSYKSSFPFERR